MQTLLAAFQNPDNAVKAAGALLDHGVENKHIDLLAGKAFADTLRTDGTHDESKENKAKHGITTTTGADAAEGAKKGAGVGAALGVLGGLASLFIPGYGIVIGSGALATAAAAALGTTAAGAAAGGATGFMKDMDVDADVVKHYEETIQKDGAVLAVSLPSHDVDEVKAREILGKYGATRINSSHHATV